MILWWYCIEWVFLLLLFVFVMSGFGFLFFFFLWPHLWHMEVPWIGIDCSCRPTPQPWQHWIHNPLSDARNQTWILRQIWVLNLLSYHGNSLSLFDARLFCFVLFFCFFSPPLGKTLFVLCSYTNARRNAECDLFEGQ